jgi:GTP:adenosylcobinamide-phosphate guanylyltransferase
MHATRFTAVVLAADRNPDDPLVKNAGACCKALVEIGGTPMLQRVILALQNAVSIGDILLSGPDRGCLDTNATIKQALDDGGLHWLEPENSPSTSAYRSMQQVSPATPVLITTADHPLLRADIVDHFLGEARRSGADVAVGMTTFASIRERFPKATKTVMRFRDGGYCGCNLFAFLTPESRAVAEAWRKVEQQRKNPLRVIAQLGWWSVLRYQLGWLSLESALERLSARLKVRIRPVILPFPESAIDVDSIADHKLVEEITGTDK